MPLTFLTADRAFGDARGDDELPHPDPDRWRRPYRPGPWRVGLAASLLLLAAFVLLSTVIIAFAGSPAETLACGVLALLIIATALRMLRMGTWVGSRGVRRVGMFATRTVSWDQVAAVRTAQQPVRWLGLPRTVQGEALVLQRRSRPDEELRPLMTTHNADFLGRPGAFDRAADRIEAWAQQHAGAHGPLPQGGPGPRS
ncbi:PH domain-containing protein [Streptomyces sp. NA04227]|uniref:PH domain-containing protein n=1 Tax=Streptomyces sp. NA04227 TaxID=2742136 RepID=UPI0015912210|nr:PH domain-containing protein [Streptomyces sp. NA04227]QKW09529.1 PH domain-containing protein [Streptomyces sp. NA04227]